MLLIISPSKRINEKKVEDRLNYTLPEFLPQSRKLIQQLLRKEATGILINLASNEYFKAIYPEKIEGKVRNSSSTRE